MAERALNAMRSSSKSGTGSRKSVAAAASIMGAAVSPDWNALNLTKIRASVLKVLRKAEKPIGAYEILRRLELALRRDVKPMTIYRAVEFLESVGLISRIETLGAYVANPNPKLASAKIHYLCELCGCFGMVEAEAIEDLISEGAATLGFKPKRTIVECAGACAQCSMGSPDQSRQKRKTISTAGIDMRPRSSASNRAKA